MLIKKFEDIEAWQEARRLVNMVYDLTNKKEFKKDFGLKEQIQRAAVSCMSNVAEGARSSSEVQSELYAALDRNYIAKEEFEKAYEQAGSVRKLANGFIRYLRTGKSVSEGMG